MSIGWLILLGILAIVVGVLATVSTVRFGVMDRKADEPFVLFRLVIIWPSGPKTYQWPRRDGGSSG